MASYKHGTFAYGAGPRQGVYPLQQLEHYKAVKWRSTQLKPPEEMYSYRERIEPAVILPGPPALPPRPLTKRSTPRPLSCNSSLSVRVRSRSTLLKSREQSTKPSTVKDNVIYSKEGESGFCVTAKSMSMQSRPSQQDKPIVPVLKQPASFPYSDPTKVKGDPAFEERLSQLVQHESNTIKQEEQKALAKKSLSRPSSARSLSSTRQRRTSSNSASSRTTGRCHSAHPHTLTSTNSHKSINDIQGHGYRNHRPMSARVPLKQTDPECKPNTLSHDNSIRDSAPPIVPKEFLPETAAGLTSTDDINKSKLKLSMETPDSEMEPVSIEDDLNVTSDLGLSVDSLQLSGEEIELDDGGANKKQTESQDCDTETVGVNQSSKGRKIDSNAKTPTKTNKEIALRPPTDPP